MTREQSSGHLWHAIRKTWMLWIALSVAAFMITAPVAILTGDFYDMTGWFTGPLYLLVPLYSMVAATLAITIPAMLAVAYIAVDELRKLAADVLFAWAAVLLGDRRE